MSIKQTVDCQSSNGLPLEQLWQTVRNNPNDFANWTLLLQYCEQSKDLKAIRESFNEFLSNYPNCYVYWKKLAEYETKFSDSNNAFKVLERAVNAFPISTDIWIYYIKLFLEYNSNEIEILSLFERAIQQSGQDFNSSELWSMYLNWLTTRQRLSDVTILYDRLFRVGIKDLSQHFVSFTKFVQNNHPFHILATNEYNLMQKDYYEYKSNNNTEDNQIETIVWANSNHSEESEDKLNFIRKKIIDDRKAIFQITMKESEERIRFENSIKRPYFHVNPLEIKQLDNWMKYLNWQINRNIPSKVIFLFERCLVACALYEHMWIRYSNYLIEKRYQMIESGEEFIEYFDSDAIRKVFRRATEIHTKKSFKIHNLWSLFEEREGNFDEAFDILDKFEKENPYLIETTISKINLLQRKRDLIAVENQFKSSIEKLIDCPKLCTHLSIKYSRFLFKIRRDTEKAIEVLNSALKYDPNNYMIYLKLIDIEYQKTDLNVAQIEQLFDKMIACIQSNSLKIAMTQRKLQFMQDFGVECHKIQSTIYGIQDLMHGIVEQNQSIQPKIVKRFKVDK